MTDLGIDIGSGGVAIESFGRGIVAWSARLNVSTALLLGGALLFDRILSRRARASFRMALYAPVALRVLLPLDWDLRIANAPRVQTLFAPLLEIGKHRAAEAQGPFTLPWYALAATAYVAIALLLAVRAAVAHVRLERALIGASPVRKLDFTVPYPVCEHADLGPMALGIVKPRIVIPHALLEPGNEHALACALRHEVAHLRRRDPWLATALVFLRTCAWPILPLWIAVARVRQLVELACDEKALDGADAAERRRYGHALLDMTEARAFALVPLGEGGLHFRSTLRSRIEALAMQRHWPLAAQAVAMCLVSTALFFACGTAPAPPDALSINGHRISYGYEFAPTAPGESRNAVAPTLSTNAEGRLVPEAIESVVRQEATAVAISSCFEAGRRKNAALAGNVNVKVVIDEDGLTKDASDESTLPDREVVDCVVGVFRGIRYPASHDGNIAVIYPIHLGS